MIPHLAKPPTQKKTPGVNRRPPPHAMVPDLTAWYSSGGILDAFWNNNTPSHPSASQILALFT
jgi:hypothetical protein